MKRYFMWLKTWRGALAAMALGLAVFAVGSIPYDDARQAADAFNGDFVYHGYLHYPEDMDSYRVFTAQSARGQWLFTNPVMPDRQSGSYVNLLWLAAGKIQWLTGCPFGCIVSLLRLVAALLLAGAIYYFLRRILVLRRRALVGTFMVFLTSGLGWAAMVPAEIPVALKDESPVMRFLYMGYFYLGSLFKWLFVRSAGPRMPSPDLYTEVSAFFQAAWVPHVAVAVGITLLVVALYADGFVRRLPRRRYAAAGLLFILQMIRPYEGFAVFGFLVLLELGFAISLLVRKRLAFRQPGRLFFFLCDRLWPLAPSFLILGYYRWLLYTSPTWRAWGGGNTYPPPSGELFLLAFFWALVGLSLLTLWLFAGGFRKKKQSRASDGKKAGCADAVPTSRIMATVLLGYGMWHIILLYGLNLSFAWRTSAPLGVVGAMALVVAGYVIYDWAVRSLCLKHVTAYIAGTALLLIAAVLVVPSNIQSFTQAEDISKTFNRYYFMEAVVDDAMDWAGKNLPVDSMVFTHGHYGLKLPAYGDLKVMLWHKDITPYFRAKKADYAAFYSTEDRARRIRLLNAYHIDFIMQGPVDVKWARYPDLDGEDYLTKIYDNGFVKIYRVIPEMLQPQQIR